MCGIWLYCGSPCDVEALRVHFMKFSHRGPDDMQFAVHYFDAAPTPAGQPAGAPTMLAVGFHRLSINGLESPLANQPFLARDTITMCNGEIWNYQALHQESGTVNETGSDCEVLAAYYSAEKAKPSHAGRPTFEVMCQALDGDFGIALYDRPTGELFVGRDRLGIRSLYHAQDADGNLFVSSELKGIPPAMANVAAFPPGQWGSFDVKTRSYAVKPYWDLRADRLPIREMPAAAVTAVAGSAADLAADPTYLGLCQEVEASLIAAVRKRFMSDRPIGCVLSGGLDSTVVTAIACKLHAELNPGAPPLRTYTIGMAGGEDFAWARIAAEHLGTEHHEFVLTERDFLDAIPHVVRQIESYDVTTVRASCGNWLLAKKISELGLDITLFCGDVADELLGGYRGFGLTADAAAFDEANLKMLENVHRFDVLRAEKSFAGNGLEGRVPFADRDFIDLAMSIPPQFKLWGGATGRIEKDILRRAFIGYLPAPLLWRRKEAFSDGVSAKQRSWYEIIQDDLKDSGKAVGVRQHAGPYDLESTHYRELFEASYASVEAIPYQWKHPFATEADPSARRLANYAEGDAATL